MSLKKQHIILIIIGIILLLFSSPINYFRANTNIETQNKLNNKNIYGSTIVIVTYHKGVSWNEKEIDFKKDTRFTVNKSSALNFGIYSKFTVELSLERLVDNEMIKTIIKAESIIWGIGKQHIKRNSFNNTIIERIDKIY